MWWKLHLDGVKSTFKGKCYTQWHRQDEKDYAAQNGIEALQGAHNAGLGRKLIHFNGNSGAQAINLAYLMGATRVILLGYDMGATGHSHWFGSHPEGLMNGNYSGYVGNFSKLASDLKREGVEVINCTPTTALTQFPKAEIGDIF